MPISPELSHANGNDESFLPWDSLYDKKSIDGCRCMPGDTCWPSLKTWSLLNDTVGGKLIATKPIGSVCHDDIFSAYDGTACSRLKQQWENPHTHYEHPSSIMQQIFANQSCDPFRSRNDTCIIGTYVSYTVNATTPEDISQAIRFAVWFNIRSVVKNTGHDYQGKSTGAGALGIWVHHIKQISFFNYHDSTYSGKAYKVGAGVQTEEAFAAADSAGLTIVGGECQSTSLAGGYAQGGGHSTLSSYFGLAADDVLEWEIVDGTGRLLMANQEHNPDLFWALRGGGGGTYGVVVSMTSKAYDQVAVAGANLSFASTTTTQDNFFDVVGVFLESLPTFLDSGLGMVWLLDSQAFTISPLTAPNTTLDSLRALLEPIISKLQELNIPYKSFSRMFGSFYEHYSAQQRAIPAGTVALGGRFIPRQVVEEQRSSYLAVLRKLVDSGASITGVSLNVSSGSAAVNNSVNPAWRRALIAQTVNLPFDFSNSLAVDHRSQDTITDIYLPMLESLTPGGGAYANEGDYQQAGWQDLFYGANYEPLRSVKVVYDPFDVFYGLHNVGSEDWTQKADGRLCRVHL